MEGEYPMRYVATKLTVALVLLLALLVACNSNILYPSIKNNSGSNKISVEPITLRIAWWGEDSRHDYTKKVIELYESQNSHVTIEMEYAAKYDDYWKKMAPQAAAAEMPDIIQIDTSYYAQYAGKHLFTDLTPYFGNEIDITNINAAVLQSGYYRDGNYGMPVGINALGFHYNPEILQEVGIEKIPQHWTWDDYEALALKAQDEGIFFDDGMRPEIFFAYFLRTKGETLYNANGTALGYSDDSLFVDFFGRLIRLVHSKATPTADAKAKIKSFEETFLYQSKQIGIWQWSNQYLAMQEAMNRPMDIAPMVGPNMEQGLYLKSSMFFSIAETSKVKSEAAKFIDFWVNDIEANKLILGERGVPVSSVVQEEIKPYLSEVQHQVFQYVAWSEQNSSPADPVDPVGSAGIIDLLKKLWEQMEYELISVEQGAELFREEANKILEKNK